MHLIFFGPPGAGKGTQAKFVSQEFKLPHLSTGDILRFRLKQKDDLAERIKKTIDKGKLVSDDILNSIISQRIIEKDCFNGFILDGYPRTLNQADFLNKEFKKNGLKIDFIFEIEINDTIIIDRITNRANIEDRSDDSEISIKTRISKFYQETKPVFSYYSNEHPSAYHCIDGNREISTVKSEILKLLRK